MAADPNLYRTSVRDLARFVAARPNARARLMLAAAVATDHATVSVLCVAGAPRYRIALDLTPIELQARCPGTDLGEFDRQIDDDKVCMVFDLAPGTRPDLGMVPADSIIDWPEFQSAEAVAAAVAPERASFVACMHREPTCVVFNNVAVREIMKWHGTLDDWDTVAGKYPDLNGLKLLVSPRIGRRPGFVLV